MNLQVTIALNAEALSAIHSLTEAIRSIGGVQAVAPVTSGAAVAETAEQEQGPIYWACNETGQFGKVDDETAYKAVKKNTAGAYKIPESIYNEKVAELRQKNDAEAQAKKEAAAAKKAEKEAAASKKAAKEAATAENAQASAVPSEEDLIAAFQAYLPKDLSKEERAERHAFVKPLLQRFGVSKATELPEEHRALAINLVQRKAAGEDVDPETAEFAEVAAQSDAEDDVI